MENNVKNKKVIIIGASSGIGLATAELLLSKGYEVINISRSCPCGGNYNTDAQNNSKPDGNNIEHGDFCQNGSGEIAGQSIFKQKLLNGTILTIIADAASEGELTQAVKQAAEGNPPYALIYSAGCSMAAPIEYADSADYRYLFDVNFFGILESIKAAVPFMKHGGGRIVLISSMGGTFPIAFDTFYSASKAAVDMLAEAGDLELKPYGIRVCSVRPGGVKTDFTFKRNIYGSAIVGDYAEKQKKAVASLAETEQGGISAEKVASTVFTMITMPNPPVKVAVGLKNKAFCAAARLLPDRMIGFINAVRYEQ